VAAAVVITGLGIAAALTVMYLKIKFDFNLIYIYHILRFLNIVK